MNRLDEMEAAYLQAATYFCEDGRQNAAAECALRAARHLEATRPESAAKLYLQAVSWIEEYGMEALSSNIYR
jgi:hypothetical protein